MSVRAAPSPTALSPRAEHPVILPLRSISPGAECLRLAAWRLCEADIVPNMLVHDAILFELESEEQINHAVEIMKAAGRDVCNGFEIGVDIEKINGGTRYVDKRSVAKEMWNTMMEALRRIGEAP